MNCKQGDLAVVIGGTPEYRGYIIKCVKLSGYWQGCWETEPKIMDGNYRIVFKDSTLKPIKGLPELDSTDVDKDIPVNA